jgi:hypothetical protein
MHNLHLPLKIYFGISLLSTAAVRRWAMVSGWWWMGTSREWRRKCCLCDGCTTVAKKLSGDSRWRSTLKRTDYIRSSETYNYNKFYANREQEKSHKMCFGPTDRTTASQTHLLYSKEMAERQNRYRHTHHGNETWNQIRSPKTTQNLYFRNYGCLNDAYNINNKHNFTPLLSETTLTAVFGCRYNCTDMWEQSAWVY